MKKHLKWLAIPIVLVLLVFAISQIDREELVRSVQQIPWWLLPALFTFQIVTQLFVNLQWFYISKLTGARLSFGQMFRINCHGIVYDSVTPGLKVGGEISRAMRIRETGEVSGDKAAAMVALQKLFFIATQYMVLLVAGGQLHIALYLLALPLLGAIVVVFFIPDIIHAKMTRMKQPKRRLIMRVHRIILALLDQMNSLRCNKKGLINLTLLSIFIWLLYPAKLYLLAMFFSPTITIFQITAITFTAYIIATLPLFPGGLGGFEGTMTALLVSAGYVVSDAAAATIVFRFVTFWFLLLFSLFCIGVYKIIDFRKKRGL
ncbi:MAG: flippase-like domain-containing protein [Oscillospiraceae bacterium]|nr:flippase-like domain-containing protein [Oscillospiraceae bacterium]